MMQMVFTYMKNHCWELKIRVFTVEIPAFQGDYSCRTLQEHNGDGDDDNRTLCARSGTSVP